MQSQYRAMQYALVHRAVKMWSLAKLGPKHKNYSTGNKVISDVGHK